MMEMSDDLEGLISRIIIIWKYTTYLGGKESNFNKDLCRLAPMDPERNFIGMVENRAVLQARMILLSHQVQTIGPWNNYSRK